MIYADTSLLVALYALEPGTDAAQKMVQRASEPLPLTPLHRVEWAHAMAQKQRLGLLSASALKRLLVHWREDRANGLYRELEWPGKTWARAEALGLRWGRRAPARTLDTLHLAAALELGARHF